MRCVSLIYLALSLFLVAAGTRPAAADGTPSGRGAALVNGVVITAEAYEAELHRMERLARRGRRPAGPVNRRQVLERLIVRELVYQEAARAGITASPAEVAERLAELKGKFNGTPALETTLDGMGLSPSDLESDLARGLVIERYLERNYAQTAQVSPDEVEFYYRDHPDEFAQPVRLRLSHLLVKLPLEQDGAARVRARKKIEMLAARIAHGEDFAAVAREASDCYSAKNGGDLGYFLPGQLSRKIEDEARLLKPGEVSGVVEDRYGLHLLKLTELRPAGLQPLDEVRDKIRLQLRQDKELKALAPLVKRLRAAAKIELLLNQDEE